MRNSRFNQKHFIIINGSMKNKFTRSGFSQSSEKNINGRSPGKGPLRYIFIFVLTFFTSGLFAKPVVTSFSPQSGPVGTTVTISGSGFNAVPANNIVFFGATRASVTSATVTSLTVSVPSGANYNYISVTNLTGNLTGYSLQPFNVTFTGVCKPVFSSGVGLPAGGGPFSVSIGDIDGDGKSDLAVANFSSNYVSVFLNISTSGGISFAGKVDFATGAAPTSVIITDLNGDGKPDMAVVNSNGNSVSVLQNTSIPGTVSFAARVDFATGSLPNEVSSGDIDGDGRPDLAVINSSSNNISVLRNTSSGGVTSFAAKVDFAFTISSGNPKSVTIGDLDGDGKPEMVATNTATGYISVFRNTSTSGVINSGSFASSVYFSTNLGGEGYDPWSVIIGDVDGDGKPDLAVANFLENVNVRSTVSIFRNISTLGVINFETRINFYPGSKASSVSFGDLDGDGKLDLAVANYNSNDISVFRNTSVTGTINTGSLTKILTLSSGGSPFSVCVGDLDGDSKPEIATANYYGNSAAVCRNLSVTAALQTAVSGNGNPITNGSLTPDITNFTDFGNVYLGENLIRTYTFQNTSSDSLSVDSIKISGTDKALFTPSSITPAGKIAPGSSKTFTVTFEPTSLGVKTASVNIYSNILSGTACFIQQTYTFAVSGTATAPIAAKVLNFDGINDYVSLPNTLPTMLTNTSTTEFTIEYWFKGTSFQSAVRFQSGSGFIVAGWNGLHIISSDGGTAGGINVGAGATDGNWHHIAVTWKKNTLNGFRSYLDGVLIAQRNSANVNLPSIFSGGYLGAYNGSSEFMNGSLDEVRIWTRALSQAEISTNRFIELNSGTALLASYHFNQGIGGGNNTGITFLVESTSNNYTGTLNNFTKSGPTSNFLGSGPAITSLITINITAIPEGLFDIGTDRLSMRDTVRSYLHSNVSPYNVVDSAVAVIDSVTFTGSFIFPNAPNGTYYIRLDHRNSLETWSMSGGESLVAGSATTYNYTNASNKAYGNNMKQVNTSPVRYGIYSGEVIHDGLVDLNDLLMIYNASSVFSTGYIITDLTGNNIVDLNDLILAFNNMSGYAAVVRP